MLDVIAATAAEALRAGLPCAHASHRPGLVVVEAIPDNVRRFGEVNGPVDRSTAGGTIQAREDTMTRPTEAELVEVIREQAEQLARLNRKTLRIGSVIAGLRPEGNDEAAEQLNSRLNRIADELLNLQTEMNVAERQAAEVLRRFGIVHVASDQSY